MGNETAAWKKWLLGAMAVIILAFVFLIVKDMFFQPDDAFPAPTQPIELQQSIPVDINKTPGADANVSVADQNTTKALNVDLDKFFASLPQKTVGSAQEAKPLPALNPTSGSGQLAHGGAMVSLPSLTKPSELQPKQGNGTPVVLAGLPTSLPAPQALQNIVIRGIACSGGTCRANTSAGELVKGSSFGGGAYISEKVEIVNMSGIQTDKRFISY